MTESELLGCLLRGDAEAALRAAEESNPGVGRKPAADVAYFEPRMRERLGHFVVLADAYRAVFAELGRSMHVFHHDHGHTNDPGCASGLFPIVDHAVGAERPVDAPALHAFKRFFRARFELGLHVSDARLAVFPTARYLTLPAIAEALVANERAAGAVIGVMETWPVPDCENEALVAGAFQNAAQTLQDSGKPVLLIAESVAIREWLVARGFDPGWVMTAPYPAAARFARRPTSRPTGDRPRLAALGATRPVHNPGVIAEYLMSAPMESVDWTVRLDVNLAAKSLAMTTQSLRQALLDRGISLLPLQLDQEAYDDALTDADVMLLPYGDRYRTIGSGIFLECLCAGVIPLVPAESTMRRLYEDLGGAAPALEAPSQDALARAIAETCQNLAQFQRNAATVRSAWLDHPHGPRAWSRRVGEWLELATA